MWSSDSQSPDEPTQSDQEPSQSSAANDSNGNSEQQVSGVRIVGDGYLSQSMDIPLSVNLTNKVIVKKA